MMFVHTKKQFASRDPFPTKIANFMYFPLYDTPLSKSFFLLGCSSSNFWSSCSSMCFWAFSTFYRTCTHASSCGRRATQRGPSSRGFGCCCPLSSASWTSSPGDMTCCYQPNKFLPLQNHREMVEKRAARLQHLQRICLGLLPWGCRSSPHGNCF